MLMAGRDFGTIVDRKAKLNVPAEACCQDQTQEDGAFAEEMTRKAQYSGSLQQYWPKPFDATTGYEVLD